MNNLVSFTLSVLMAYTVYAQSPYLSLPYYYYNQNKPTQQNNDQHVLHRDAMMSVVLRELKETSERLAKTNIMVEDVKKEMANRDQEMAHLKNELAQLKQSADEQIAAESVKKNETQTQTEIVATEFQPYYPSKDGVIATGRFCNCRLLQQTTDKLSKDLTATNVKLDALAAQTGGLEPTTIDKEPASCADLKQLGYKNSGIFSIKVNNQVQNVYCDFTKSDNPAAFQKLIGIVDVKTTRVSFHAQLNAPYTTSQSTVPFDMIVTNVGDGMSTTTGIFTAPVAGTYLLAFSGTSKNPSAAIVLLQKKTSTGSWDTIGLGFGAPGSFQTFALQSIIALSKGDEIRVYLDAGEISETDQHMTNFVGFLIEESTFFVAHESEIHHLTHQH